MANHKETENIKTELINELRLTLGRLEDLNDTLETKASAFLAFTSILITLIITLVSSNLLGVKITLATNNQNILLFLLIMSFLISFTCVFIFLFKLLNPRSYIYPFSFDPNDMINIPENKDIKDYIIDEYRQVIPQHTCLNVKKAELLKNARNSLFIALMCSFGLLIYSFILRGVIIG